MSVIVVAFESRRKLERCLPSLMAQRGISFEVIVVDNGSSDGTVKWLQASYPQVRLLRSPANLGYGGGNNLGAAAASGDVFVFLNPDTEVAPGALAELARVVVTNANALVTAKLVGSDGRLNACGLNMHYGGIATCRGLGARPEDARGVLPVLLASGAALVVHRSHWRALGGFHPDYFMYLEDVDLSLRARMLGLEILCAADATIRHDYRLEMTPRKFYYLERNRLLTVLRLYQGPTLLRLGLGLVFTEAATWCFACLHGPAYVAARFRGYAWLWRRRDEWLRERKQIQAGRRVSDGELLPRMEMRLPFAQLVSWAALGRFLDRTTTVFFRQAAPWRRTA